MSKRRAKAMDVDEFDAAREFLEYDLRDSVDEQRDRVTCYQQDNPRLALQTDAAADRLEELAGPKEHPF